MRPTRAAAALALLSLAATTTARAATIFLSTSATNPRAVTNPVVLYGSSSGPPLYTPISFYVWAQLGTVGSTTEKLTTIGIDLRSTDPFVITFRTPADTSFVNNAAPGSPSGVRWSGFGASIAGGGGGLTGIRLTSAGTDGLDGDRTPDAVGDHGERFYRILTVAFDYPFRDGHTFTDLFLQTNSTKITFASGRAGTDNHFGAGDAAVDFGLLGGGTVSTLADAKIVFPEPAALPLAAAAPLLARRRRA